MEKSLKVSELAALWEVSVPTTWNRIRKEGLSTFKKKDENGKEINFINISDDIINSYINNVNNNDNELNNNGYYEELLSSKNNVNKLNSNNNGISASDLFEKLTSLNNEYNDRIERLNNELITSEKQRLLLEDKASREGLYLKEINELETDNEKLKTHNKMLFTVLTVIITVLITVLITIITVNNISNNKSDQPEISDIKKGPEQTIQVRKTKNIK